MEPTYPVLFSVDENGEATGYVHWFCSTDCRSKNPIPDLRYAPFIEGFSPTYTDGLVCENENCGKPLQ